MDDAQRLGARVRADAEQRTSEDRAALLAAARARYRRIESEPLPPNLTALLREAAAAAPETTALHFIEGDVAITYARLLADVERLANGLVGLGVGRGSHVAVMLPNIRE